MNPQNAAPVTVGLGVVLTLLALGFYFPTGETTALIPAAFGLPILICGVLAFKANLRKHTIHIALAFSALGVLSLLGMVARLFTDNPPATLALVETLILSFLCLVYIILGVQSFRRARQQREAQAAST